MIGKFERNKDLIQELTSSGARHVGNIATIITSTVVEVTREIGDWVTDAIEMREAAAAAEQDRVDTDALRDRVDTGGAHPGRSEPDVLVDESASGPANSPVRPVGDADVGFTDEDR